MISKKLEKALNAQIKLEAEASFNYLAMASWCEEKSLTGAAEFFYAQSDDEREHMLKIFRYINDLEGHAIAPAVDQPELEYESILDVCRKALAGEQKVTRAIHRLAELANAEKDYATYNFLQFFVDEQRESETVFIHLIDKIKLIGLEGMGLYYIDKEMESLARQTPAKDE
ncbi:MAG: ferritin [Chitinophagales bacterium]|nr:MAG: ferritin [Chitinophagales bacterium]